MPTTIATLQGYLIARVSKDVELDSNTALVGHGNVQIETVGETGGFITFPIPASVVASVTTDTPCTVIIQQ